MEQNIKRVLQLLREDAWYTLTELALQMPDDYKQSSIQQITVLELEMNRVAAGETPKKKVEVKFSVQKVMVTVFLGL